MDDEVAVLDAQLADAEVRVADLECAMQDIKVEWEETYPYDELARALEIISRLTDKVLENNPEDIEAQALYEEAEGLVTPKLQEPEVFHLA